MSKLEQVRSRLRAKYQRGLVARQAALRVGLAELAAGHAGAEEGLRRIAHQLSGSGASYGFPEISATAASAEHAPIEALAERVAALIAALGEASRGGQPVRWRALLVEDDDDLCALLSVALADAAVELRKARSTEAAREWLARERFDLVLLDLALEDSDGRELLGELSDSPSEESPPVVVLTANDNPLARAECLSLGVVQYLIKPVDPEVLVVTVQALMAQSHRPQELVRDPLTGALTRASFEEHCAHLMSAGAEACVAFMDLDHFKSVNDTFGHAMGDEVLRRFAEVLTEQLRSEDVICRWGGEEFVAVLPGTTEANATAALRRVLAAMRKQRFGRSGLTATFSAGVVRMTDQDLDASIHNADALMYAAKEAGRGRVFSTTSTDCARPTQVLLVEDDPDIALAIQDMLQEEGLAVAWCSGGHQGLKKARSEHYALVILDAVMPDLSGFEVLRYLRTLPGYAQVPITMLTALDSDDDVELAFALGADDYLEKPLRPRQIRARLRRMLKRAG